MSTDEYVPEEVNVRMAYVLAGVPDNASPDSIKRAERRAGPEFDRFLARVRRDAWQAGHTTGFEDALLACEIATGVKPGPPPGPTRNPHEETP